MVSSFVPCLLCPADYARRPLNAHPDFYALWADGHGREPSQSSLYFCDRQGNVRVLPRQMSGDFAEPKLLENKPNKRLND